MVKTYAGSRASREDQGTEIAGTGISQGASSVHESADAIGLDGGAHEGRAPGGGSTGSLLGLEEFLLGVGGLGAVVGLTEDGGKDGERGGVVEDGADGDSRWLDGREIWRENFSYRGQPRFHSMDDAKESLSASIRCSIMQ